MRKILIFFSLILFISLISGIEINSKDSFNKGENFIAEISGNFIDTPLKENIAFYREHIRTPVDYGLIKIGDLYFIYGYLPFIEGNYSFEIDNVKYREGVSIKDEKIVYPFKVINETADFVVKPGMVNENKDFFIEVTNLRTSRTTITLKNPPGVISYDFSSARNSFEILSGNTKRIYFDTSKSNSFIDLIEITSDRSGYLLPVYFISNKSSQAVKEGLNFDSDKLDFMLSSNTSYVRFLEIKNNGNKTGKITFNVSNSLKDMVKLKLNSVDSLGEGSSLRIEFDLINLSEGYHEGYISAETGGTKYFSYLYLNVTRDFIPAIEEIECSQMGGSVCSADTECIGGEEIINGVRCCVGICREKETTNVSNNRSKIVGWTLLVGVLLFLIWFYLKKYKGTKNEISLFKKK